MEFDGVYKLRSLSDDFSKLMKTMGKWNLSQSITLQCIFLQSYRSHRARHQVGDGPQEQHNVDPDEEQGRKHHLHHWDHHGASHEPHYYSQGAINRRFSYLFSFNIFKTIPATYFQVGQTIELMKPLPIRMTLLKMEQDELHIKM